MSRMTKAERADWALGSRDDADKEATAAGHHLDWTEMQGGWSGTCGDCGANVVAFAGGTSSRSTRDARTADCGGPGTSILTQIEDERFAQLVDQDANRFEAELDEAWDEPDYGGEELEL